jgi:hypothetical protein
MVHVLPAPAVTENRTPAIANIPDMWGPHHALLFSPCYWICKAGVSSCYYVFISDYLCNIVCGVVQAFEKQNLVQSVT